MSTAVSVNHQAANTNIMAVPDAMNTASCGAIVYWRLCPATDLDRLAHTWADRNLDPDLLPEPPTASEALHRAMKAQTTPRLLLRPLGKRRSQGLALVEETPDGGRDLDYAIQLRAWLEVVAEDGTTRSVVRFDRSGTLEWNVRAAYGTLSRELSSNDIGAWLVKLADRQLAVPLRDTGGLYFVPSGRFELFRAMGDAVNAASDARVYSIPALPAADAVEAILDGLTTEASKEAAGIAGEVNAVLTASDDVGGGGAGGGGGGTSEGDAQREASKLIGHRALKGRLAKCGQLDAKLNLYEELLGAKLTALHDRLELLRSRVGLAILATAPEEE
jgi:hypothetical protein